MRRPKIILLSLAIVCAVLGIGLFIHAKHRGVFATNYHVSHYFSQENFARIKPGMSPDQVRDLIGPPVNRRELQSGRCYWVYSVQDNPAKRYKQLSVVFDNATKSAIRTEISVVNAYKDPKTKKYTRLGPATPASPWKITSFDYSMIQGNTPAVGTDSDKVYVIQVMASWCGPCAQGRVKVEELIEHNLADMPVELMLVSVDESEQAMQEYLEKHNLELPVAWDPKRDVSKPMSVKLIPHYLILRDNTVYPFDFAHYMGQSEDYYDNLAWFLRHHCKN